MRGLYHNKKAAKNWETRLVPADGEKSAGGRYGNRKVKNGENK